MTIFYAGPFRHVLRRARYLVELQQCFFPSRLAWLLYCIAVETAPEWSGAAIGSRRRGLS
ncbi:MAG: hypothetical protein ABJ215_05275 [Alphaproteobacteria bacterium]